MALNKITYTDKVNTSGLKTPEINYINDVDLNEIKQVANATIDSLEGTAVKIGLAL